MVVCAVCKKRIEDQRDGLYFHACDDWLHFRLFLCSACSEKVPMQTSLHEQCCECSEPPIQPRDARDDPSPRFHDLSRAIKGFEQVHNSLFAVVPFTSLEDAPEATHPGSANLYSIKRWCDKYGGGDSTVG